MHDASFSKAALRADIQKRLQELRTQDFLRAGLEVGKHIERWLSLDPALLKKGRVALFKSLKDELATVYLAEFFARRTVQVCYPVFDAHGAMHFASDKLHQNGAGKASDFDLIFVPGRAFDRAGHRLGRGLGCYDRTLAALASSTNNPLLIGLALDNQVVERVPAEPHDVRMHFICSPALGLLKTSE